MNELIKIESRELSGATVQTIDARELHAFLEVKSEFRNWIKNRVDDFSFVQGVDFVAGKFLPGSDRVDYYLSLDMAKELSMVERNEKGKQARQYFIECERRAKAVDPMQVLSDPAAMRGLLLNYTEKVIKLESKVAEQAPKVEALERFSDLDGKHGLRSAAKLLGIQEHKLRTWLLANKWFYRDHAGRLCSYAEKINTGHLDTQPVEIHRTEGIQVVPHAVITQKGLAKLGELLARDGLLPKTAA